MTTIPSNFSPSASQVNSPAGFSISPEARNLPEVQDGIQSASEDQASCCGRFFKWIKNNILDPIWNFFKCIFCCECQSSSPAINQNTQQAEQLAHELRQGDLTDEQQLLQQRRQRLVQQQTQQQLMQQQTQQIQQLMQQQTQQIQQLVQQQTQQQLHQLTQQLAQQQRQQTAPTISSAGCRLHSTNFIPPQPQRSATTISSAGGGMTYSRNVIPPS